MFDMSDISNEGLGLLYDIQVVILMFASNKYLNYVNSRPIKLLW